MSDLKREASDRWVEAKIEDGVIVIRVPVSVLPAALEQNPRNDSYRGSLITNLEGFARDVVIELNREEKDGTTPVHLLFDKAMAEAIEQGSLHYAFPEVKR